ncbi:MAG TPA: HAMP domain-containing sensor histidine kinase [Candidatus Ozemobacteraceae bacterium]|nr:HAMP domain-containing sensor histidine kinase [Candidatus Ozemobacteraceae bacterium]
MSIRFKIGIGFALMIVALTGLIISWGARTLGLQLEEADLGKLTSLRDSVILEWSREKGALASVAGEITPVLAGTDFGQTSQEWLLKTVELFKRHLQLDWLDIRRNGTSLLYPLLRPAPLVYGTALPQRIALSGPLSNFGFVVHVVPLPASETELIVARRPTVPAKPLMVLWDSQGLISGNAPDWPAELRTEYASREATFQRLMHGKLYRLRATAFPETGQTLLIGYEADSATLTRTGVDDLMLRLAILEILAFLVLGYFLARRLFSPLERLKQAIDRVSAGHWQQIPVTEVPDEADEIGTVARSFNRMVLELSAARDRLIAVQQELMSKEKMAMLGRFSAGLAHEINNPLGTILASAGLALDAVKSGKPVESDDIVAIIDETKRCRRIVESLLEYAHNRPPRLTAAPLGELIAETVRIFSDVARRAGIELDVAEKLDTAVLVDRTGIGQVLSNLLRNAADALHDQVSSGKAATIRVSATVTGDGFAVVTVSDNGPGLGEAADHLFEPLVTTKPQGTGLGLAICQSIIEGHGGRIWAERRADGWTVFSFTLRTAGGENS